ncbi:major facilitator superfamily domain-containing protein [Thermothelomyces heterothallicus CBS 202.75]|uniref:major facilitator superfamily domain-containing protein n=1 Tax=Thermothelomyces heterothallicus CBS 202.75 TaxID=1149848 RepID=UPI0037445FE0
MKTTRYSTSRQKACQPCSNAKAKCDHKAPSCGRWSAALDFSHLDLVCPINADDIRNRWLNSYIPVPGQTTKTLSTAVTAFTYRILKSYAAIAVRGHGSLPFLHPAQPLQTGPNPPLSACLSLIRICEKPLPGSEGVAAEVLQREMDKLHGQYDTYDDMTLLAAFQAYLICILVFYFLLGREADPFLRQAIMNLQEIACSCSSQGLVCAAEQGGTRPKWESWIVAEAKRRTLFTMYLLDNMLSAKAGLPTFLGTELRGLLAPASKWLWHAGTRDEWEKSYNVYLAEWSEGGLRIDELWSLPPDLDEADVVKRHSRVDRWLQSVDEFGTMMYAVTSCTHGMRQTPEAPYSIFDKRQKALIVLVVSVAATFSGFASNIYFPALPTVARDLGISIELVNLTVTTYLVFQAIAPSLWGPVSDVKGRRIAYCGTFVVFFGACIGLAEAKTYAAVLVLRCLQSTGSASTIAIGSGAIGDITTRDERGGFMGIFQAGLLVPVAVGPVIGGALAGSLGWRSIFWFLAIYSGVFLVLLILFMPETLRSIVGNGSRTPSNPAAKYPLVVYQRTTKIKWDPNTVPSEPPARKRIDLVGPFHILVSKQAAPIIVFLAVYYAVWQMTITAMSSLFQEHYGLGETEIGLTFIANGVGSMIGTLIMGKILDMDYRRFKAQYEFQLESTRAAVDTDGDAEDDFPLEKARLHLVPVFALLQCASVIVFGWTIQYPQRVHIAVPIVTTFVTGWTAIATQSVVMTCLVDVFHDRSVAASASLNLARCLFAAGGTSFVMPMINGIGVGPACTVCVGAQLVAMLGLAVQWRLGGKWRKEAEERRRAK